MGAGVIIEIDETRNEAAGMLQRGKLLLRIHALCFQYSVEAFRYGVVRGLVIFCHRDSYPMFLQHGNIGIAAVLHAAVGVMDET